MKKRGAIIATLLLILWGCKGKNEDQAPNQEQSSAPEAAQSKSQRGLLRIEAEMLRDLKVTTALVEERPGGEGTVLLGELHVNENTYAEIGSPIQARVVAVLVSSVYCIRAGAHHFAESRAWQGAIRTHHRQCQAAACPSDAGKKASPRGRADCFSTGSAGGGSCRVSRGS